MHTARDLLRKIVQPCRQKAKATRLWEYTVLPVVYSSSKVRARAHSDLFSQITAYCLFIGHGRSGHSVVGALLDAHPDAVIPDELDTLRYLEAGFKKDQICEILLTRSARLAAHRRVKPGRQGKDYCYYVPGQWQGRFRNLRVVGDSQAGLTTRRLAKRPELLQQLERVMGVPIRIIHVVRNPFDNIATLMVRGKWTFDQGMTRYFENCETIERLRARFPASGFLVLRHEDLLDDPKARLTESCRFLGLEPDEDYLQACGSILFKSPSGSRRQVPWTNFLVHHVHEQIARFDFLHGYHY